MMGDFLRLLLDSIQFLWPFRKVEQWERGQYYIFGKAMWVVGPGVWPLIPWFMEVRERSTVPGIVRGNRQDITLRDGSWLSFSASAIVRVADLNLALNTVDQYDETVQELLEAVLADKLAQVEVSRLAPEKVNRLLADLTRWVADEAAAFGVEVHRVRFVTFVHKPRIFRLLGDTQAFNSW
jgi:regulator of protease activity HflC (stomatin/prohibitin superfamily)